MKKLEDYNIHISFLTSNNKLLIKRLIKPKYILNDIYFRFKRFNINIFNPRIQLLSVIGYSNNNFIIEIEKIIK